MIFRADSEDRPSHRIAADFGLTENRAAQPLFLLAARQGCARRTSMSPAAASTSMTGTTQSADFSDVAFRCGIRTASDS